MSFIYSLNNNYSQRPLNKARQLHFKERIDNLKKDNSILFYDIKFHKEVCKFFPRKSLVWF